MEFQLKCDIPESHIDLSYQDGVLLMGSCFSDSIGAKFEKGGFNVESNTFGTLFHPIAISNVLRAALMHKKEIDVFQRDDLFFSWDAASKIYSTNESDLVEMMHLKRLQLFNQIKNCRVICITFGTAWAYRLKRNAMIVGNCHKASAQFFDKEFSTIEEMKGEWEQVLKAIRAINPTVKMIFTVSPVRHVKDGLVNNAKSKARLFELIGELAENHKINYFPAYEIVMDELRDYRFYESDLVHPNKQAIDFIWEKFMDFAFSEQTRLVYEERNSLLNQLNHKSLHPDSQVDKSRLALLQKKCVEFEAKHPEIQPFNKD